MQGLRTFRHMTAGTAIAVLVGCASAPYAPRTVTQPVTSTPEPSPQSQALAAHYASLEQQMRARGLLMQDTGTPVSARILARNFEAIALYDEYTSTPSGYVRQNTPSRLRRWETPVRMGIEFGASVPVATRQSDRAIVASYAQRLTAVTGHPITITTQNPNFLVLFSGLDDQAQMDARLRSFAPELSEQDFAALENLPKSTYCTVLAIPARNHPYTYAKAIAVIRAEHPPRLRQSCVHEEIAQGLGLANDSPFARPSIFNDNNEYGVLTYQDELMLKMLYDPRLTPGLSADQARSTIQTLAAELAG